MINVKQTGRLANISREGTEAMSPSTDTEAASPTPPKTVQVKVKVSANKAFYLLDTFACSEIQTYKDGSLSAVFPAPDESWLPGMLLSFGPDMKIISPKAIRNQVMQLANGVVKLYNN